MADGKAATAAGQSEEPAARHVPEKLRSFAMNCRSNAMSKLESVNFTINDASFSHISTKFAALGKSCT